MPRRAPGLPSPQEVLRGHYEAVSTLIGSGAGEAEVGVALTRAEAAGLDRTALRQAVREGALDRGRRAEVAETLDRYRLLLDPLPALPGLDPPPLTGQPSPRRGPRGGRPG